MTGQSMTEPNRTEQSVWICGLEEGYMRRLAAFIEQREPGWGARVFAGRKELETALEEASRCPPQRILIPAGLAGELAAQPLWTERTQVRLAAETPEEAKDAEDAGLPWPGIDRYQPAAAFVKALLAEETRPDGAEGNEPPTLFIGFYSPVHGCGQTLAALALAQCLAEKERVLYLNLERDPALDPYVTARAEGSLSDLLYHVREGSAVDRAIPEATSRLGALELILPGARAEDLRCAGKEDWERLLRAIARRHYRTVILDVGEGPQEDVWLLAHCRIIVAVTRADALAQEKEKSWWQRLSLQGEEALLGRVIRLILPAFSEGFVEPGQLRYSAYGKYMRQFAEDMIRKEPG